MTCSWYFLLWYATVRLLLENLRVNNWTFFSVPTAILVSAIAIVGSLVVLAIRHRPGAVWEPWGKPPPPEEETLEDEEWLEDDETDGAKDEAAEADEADGADDFEPDEPDDADEVQEDDAGDPAEGTGDDPGAGGGRGDEPA